MTTSSDSNGRREEPWQHGGSDPMVCANVYCLFWNERLEGKPKAAVHDSSAQTKPDEQSGEFEAVDDFDDTPSGATARSRPWSLPGRSLQSTRTATSRRILDEFVMIDVPPLSWHRSILMTFLTGFCRHKCVVGCCLEARGWDHRNVQQSCQPRAATQATAKFLKKLSDAQHDRHGQSGSHNGNRNIHDRRLAIGNLRGSQ